MTIKQLQWDTDLFGYEVGKITISRQDELDIDSILKDSNKLLYIFCEEQIDKTILNDLPAVLVDEKTELAKYFNAYETIPQLNPNLSEISSVNPSLIELALKSGIYSRFNIDTNFITNEFQKLYTAWIEKSITKEIAEKVIAYKDDNKFIGIVTISIENNEPVIGLLSVDEAYHRKNIGTQLLNYATAFSLQNNYSALHVTTQGANIPAINFYKKNGFEIKKRTYIYHLWK